MNDENLWRDLGVGGLIAAFSATMLILYSPAAERPKFWSAVGRIGIAVVASLLVGAVASDVFGATPKLVYAACGVAGIFGERVFVGLSRYLKVKHDIDLSKPKEGEGILGEEQDGKKP